MGWYLSARDEIRQSNFSCDFKAELLHLLKKEKTHLERLQKDFDSKRNLKHLKEIKRRFPLFNDHEMKLKKFGEYPHIVLTILIAKHIENKMRFFYRELYRKTSAMKNYFENGNDDVGKKTYDFLFASGRRGISEKNIKKELAGYLKNISTELSDYENETEVYSKRNIEFGGLTTNDAVKCLKDFDGRTFAFLRTICLEIKTGYRVLDVGVGTGILSIAATVAGAKKVVGVEINPITCILANTVVEYLEENKVLKKGVVEILWGDALRFATKEHIKYKGTKFDAVISENIYTGMFFELQMRMKSHLIENGLVPTEKSIVDGFLTISSKRPIIPRGMSSCAELMQLSGKVKSHTEVISDLKKTGIKTRLLSRDHIYDQIKFYIHGKPEISTVMKFPVIKKGRVDAINIFSTVCMTDGDYLERNENKFLCNDSVLILNKGVDVKKGDLIVVGLSYNEADNIENIILEVRKLNKDGTVNKKYDARLNISERKHKENIVRYMKVNKCRQEINLSKLGDFELVRSASYDHGYERIWMSDIDYVNIKEYGL